MWAKSRIFKIKSGRCRRRVDKMSWADRVRNEEELHRARGERNIIQTIKRKKANSIGHIFRRDCVLKHVIEGKYRGKIEVTGRGGKIHKQLLDKLKVKEIILEIERGSTRSRCVGNSRWKTLWPYRKTGY
jgi:hypothetical protein